MGHQRGRPNDLCHSCKKFVYTAAVVDAQITYKSIGILDSVDGTTALTHHKVSDHKVGEKENVQSYNLKPIQKSCGSSWQHGAGP